LASCVLLPPIITSPQVRTQLKSGHTILLWRRSPALAHLGAQEPSVKKTALTAIVALLLVGLTAGWYFWPFSTGHLLRFSGVVEIQEVRLGSKIGGRVARVLITEGQMVYPGQELVVFEVPELEAQRAQILANLAAAKADALKAENGPRDEEKQAAEDAMNAARARHERAKNGWRDEEKRQAESELAMSRAELVRSSKDLERIAKLYQSNSATQSDIEAATAARDKAQAQVGTTLARHEMLQRGTRQEDIDETLAEWRKTRANFELLRKGTRPEEIALAHARVAEVEAKLKEVETNIKESVVIVPKELGKGIVEVLAVRPGDLVPANQPILRVLRAEDLWVKVFVPETQLGTVKLDREVEVTIDAYPHRRFQGRVIQKATISEFTPRNVQSLEERRYQVFGVKIRVDDPQGAFNAGMAAEVTIPID
jgi:multidrug resistance efflux pump